MSGGLALRAGDVGQGDQPVEALLQHITKIDLRIDMATPLGCSAAAVGQSFTDPPRRRRGAMLHV
jgi:hypothetical protein